ncbi:MAG TPA: hypothetical protein VKT78_08830 [Fimbriimonadaceae bacterium]|nr:hypothetical protein [Fimbriimonadaceae bacterium]
MAGRYGVVGKQAHDLNLVAAMHVAGIPAILTLNPGDFERYVEIQVLSPESV